MVHDGRDPDRVIAIRAMVLLDESASPHLAGHSDRVSAVAERVARRLGWDEGRAAALAEVALLQDAGHVGVPRELDLRPGPLAPAERDRLRAHAEIGALMVARALPAEQVAWVRAHHERWDGLGYPDGLAGEAIPEGARILATADAWVAVTSARPHRPALDAAGAVAELRAHAGTQLWPAAVAALCETETGDL